MIPLFLLSPQKSYALGLLCSFNTSPVLFGTYNPISKGDVISSGNVAVTCVASTAIVLKLSQGNSGTTFNRYMSKTGATDKLYYNNYLDSGRTVIWGDGTNGTSYFSQTIISILNSYNIPIYGKVIGQQTIEPGMYSDTIIVELTL